MYTSPRSSSHYLANVCKSKRVYFPEIYPICCKPIYECKLHGYVLKAGGWTFVNHDTLLLVRFAQRALVEYSTHTVYDTVNLKQLLQCIILNILFSFGESIYIPRILANVFHVSSMWIPQSIDPLYITQYIHRRRISCDVDK